jgi:hypothetical protein
LDRGWSYAHRTKRPKTKPFHEVQSIVRAQHGQGFPGRGTTIARKNDAGFERKPSFFAGSFVNTSNTLVKHSIHSLGTVNRQEKVSFDVPINQRFGLTLVRIKSNLDGVFAVIGPLNDVAATVITAPVVSRRLLHAVIVPTRTANPATRQTIHHEFRRHSKIDDQVNSERLQQLREGFGLMRRARKPVKNKATTASVTLRQTLGHNPDNDFVGNEIATVDENLSHLAHWGARLHGRTKHIARRNMGNHIMTRQLNTLCPFACALLSKQN